MAIDCFDKINLPGLKDKFNSQVKKEMTDQERRELGKKIALDYHKELHDELNKFKKSIGKPQDEYIQQDHSDKVSEINSIYDKKIEELKSTEQSTTTEDNAGVTPPEPPEEAKLTIEDGEEPLKRTGIKNDVSDSLRTVRELPKVDLPKLGKDSDIISEGKRLVDEGHIDPQAVVNRVLSTKGGMEPDEAKAMQYYMHQLGSAEDLVRNQLAQNLEPTEKANLVGQIQQLNDMMDAATEANMIAGKAWSDVGNIRQILIDQSFNTSREKAVIKDAYGGEIPKEVQEKLDATIKERDEAVQKLKETEDELREVEAEKKVQQIKKEVGKGKKDTKQKIDDLFDELKKAKDEHDQWLKDQGIQKSGIGGFVLTPKMIKIVGKIAAAYVERGYEKLSELIDQIHEDVKGFIPGIDKNDIRDAIALHESEKLNTKAQGLEKKLSTGTVKTGTQKLKIKIQNNSEWVKANQRVVNAEFKIRNIKRKAFESQKNMYQKTLMWGGRLTRLSILSGTNVLYKLAAAATIGAAGKRIPEQVIGSIWSQVFRGVAEKAPVEGFLNANSEAKFYTEFFNPKKFVHNSWEILKTGESDLSKKFNQGAYEHVPGLYLPTDLHQVIKDPVKRATYEASLRNSMVWAEKNNLDINDSLVINAMEAAAYKRANYEIFQEQNWLSRKFTAWKNKMEKSGNLGATGKFLADFLIPVSTVPTNIVRRLVTTSPAGLIRGGAKVIQAYRNGIEHLTNEEADSVMKQLKQGTLGTALWLIGWYGYAHFGGLYSKYDPNKKRKEGELASDEMEVNGDMIPKPVQHALPLEIIQWAATARRIYENYRDNKGASIPESVYNAGMGSIGALTEQIPVVETAAHLLGAANNPYEAGKLKDDVKRRFVPQILRETGVISSGSTKGTVNRLDKSSLRNYNDNGRALTNKEFDEFSTKREDAINAALDKLKTKGAAVIENGKVVVKEYDDLTQDQIDKETNYLKSQATNQVKQDMFGKDKKTRNEKVAETKLQKERKKLYSEEK